MKLFCVIVVALSCNFYTSEACTSGGILIKADVNEVKLGHGKQSKAKELKGLSLENTKRLSITSCLDEDLTAEAFDALSVEKLNIIVQIGCSVKPSEMTAVVTSKSFNKIDKRFYKKLRRNLKRVLKSMKHSEVATLDFERLLGSISIDLSSLDWAAIAPLLTAKSLNSLSSRAWKRLPVRTITKHLRPKELSLLHSSKEEASEEEYDAGSTGSSEEGSKSGSKEGSSGGSGDGGSDGGTSEDGSSDTASGGDGTSYTYVDGVAGDASQSGSESSGTIVSGGGGGELTISGTIEDGSVSLNGETIVQSGDTVDITADSEGGSVSVNGETIVEGSFNGGDGETVVQVSDETVVSGGSSGGDIQISGTVEEGSLTVNSETVVESGDTVVSEGGGGGDIQISGTLEEGSVSVNGETVVESSDTVVITGETAGETVNDGSVNDGTQIDITADLDGGSATLNGEPIVDVDVNSDTGEVAVGVDEEAIASSDLTGDVVVNLNDETVASGTITK